MQNLSSTKFDQIIDKYRIESFSERDKGDRFEKLIKAYLLTKPEYKSQLSDVWLWSEFPEKSQFGTGGKDTGIDLVCRTLDGEYWAVQCKCYQKNKKIDLATVSTFITTSQFPFSVGGENKNFSHRIWIDTTINGFNSEAQNAIDKLHVARLGLIDLKNDSVDWEKLDAGLYGDKAASVKYDLREHQQKAYDSTIKYFENHNRGKLIMACGTGKTFTSLRISEGLARDSHLVLFLVPSIALLSQTLKEWSAQCKQNIYPICICSDAKASKANDDTISNLVLPATTDTNKVRWQFLNFKRRQAKEGGMIVVFSTYQSIDVISKVQKAINLSENDSFIFDLIVCDEAHRTTGYTPNGREDSAFVKVHSDSNVKAKKRLYMTATPKLYDTNTQTKAKETETTLWSMDDAEIYGEEIYRIGFGEAVEKKLLSDYKVVVLTLDENSVDPKIQKIILDQKTEDNKEIKAVDAIKLIGCINVLSKRTNYLTDKELFTDEDPEPMKSAVAFCSNIENSKYLRDSFNVCQKAYYENMSEDDRADLVVVEADHVDGSMGSSVREEKLDWLKKADSGKKECRILNNVRCLSEGVDVPSLDAILFLSSRNSEVDVVQSVGRVMRRAEGKKYGYIIIPVIVPSNSDASEILDKSDDFKIVWTVLKALRAHDDRFNATVNKLELNKKKPKSIRVTGGGNFGYGEAVFKDGSEENWVLQEFDFDELQQELYDKFQDLQSQVFAKMVSKVGSRRYWADWGKDVGEIAKRNIERINKLIAVDGDHKEKFNAYWEGLKKNLNPSVSQGEAVEMLAQHMITKPVFEALFGNDHFTKENPVSKSLEDIVALLDEKSDPEDLEKLERFYDDVRKRADGIDNAEAKQKVVVELYDSFFKNAFPMTVEKLGIVYTPVPVVDFILHSTEYVLNKEFGRSISDEKVNVIDPFTGTGTFITRLLQSGIIKPEDLERKYKHEIFANEIVLLAYYIASVNIENAYHDLSGKETYEPFGGICLTDTFQLYENGDPTLNDEIFSENSDRVNEQKKQPITVIVGNPPYSVGQKSANDNAQNQSYPKLEGRISSTYVAKSEATLKNSTYDSYIKAFRWASDRLDKTDGGVIAFVSNGAWLDGNAQDGFRKTIEQEFSSIYVFNLRGNQRTSGELSRKEGGKIFGSGSRTPIAITLLVKKSGHSGKAKIMYHDIGDYLSREDKLKIISDFHDIAQMKLDQITPNEHGDWISVRNEKFSTWIPLGDKKTSNNNTFFVPLYSNGAKTQRDAWSYNSSYDKIESVAKESIDFYNNTIQEIKEGKRTSPEFNTTKISWSDGVLDDLKKERLYNYDDAEIREAMYRPFFMQKILWYSPLVDRMGKLPQIFPTTSHKNLLICIPGLGDKKDFSTLITNTIPDLGMLASSQCFPLYWYEIIKPDQNSLFGDDDAQIIKHEGVTDFILERAQTKYGNKVQREDIFYYVYGLLHSKSYKETYSADLKKMMARIPLVSDYEKFWAFSKAGRELANLHLNYEKVAPSPDVTVDSLKNAVLKIPKSRNVPDDALMVAGDNERAKADEYAYYAVEQMKFPKKGQKDTIIYNHYHTIKNIPEKAYEYVVNGKSAIEWIMERYAVTTDKKSGITNNPNDWSREHQKPRYILDLLLSVINISVQTVDIVNSLPEVDWDKE
ncbi:DEAD/DEAH box helicase [Treponema saccharophilum]|uniref:Type III restriction protein res subunit n=1 Tax=Treponema saccharophilum DSM 2985 TaxID=907348 RepID=H7EKW4_9SPIR|nr:type ISP restriction/modification enzyme [Treponema saccharophilum]EIC01689.1 type III restriction protein res subunit [Treponema saccharophilum DSM 2985]BDC97069.1 helicase [Treponema saccharophilum]